MTSPTASIPEFELLKQIGRGAYGEVWLARSVTGVYRAVKIVYRDRFEESRPFEREFAGIKRFEPISRSQENLIDVLHVGRNDALGFFYYVMELADEVDPRGETAAAQIRSEEWIKRYRPKSLREVLAARKRLPAEECLPIATGLARAAKHLHDHGLVHRDIKPSNVIFVNGAPKLADIGLISGVEEARSFVGTEGFVPPEGPGTPAADLFSLGKVFYEMGNGRDRLDFPKLPDDLETIPDRQRLLEFNEIVLKACDSASKRRYGSAGALLEDLLLLQAGRSVKRLRMVERRLAWLAPSAVVLAIFGSVILLVQYFKTKEAQDLARTETRYRREAEAQELTTRQLLYAADMNLAHQAYAAGDLGRVRSLLEGCVPKAGAPDLRGFEWRYYWALGQGGQSYTFPAEKYPVAELAFSRDGRQLAAAAYDHRAEIWDVETHQLLHGFSTQGPVENMGLSPDGNLIAISDSSGCVDVKQVSDGAVAFHLQGKFRRLAVCPVGTVLALGGGGKQATGAAEQESVTVWDYESKRLVYSFAEAGTYVAFSPDGRYLATGSLNAELKLWDLKDGQLIRRLRPVELNFGMCFSPKGDKLAVGDQLGYLHLWDVSTGNHLAGVRAHNGEIFKVAFSPDGKLIGTVSADQTIRLCDAGDPRQAKILRGHTSEVWGLAFAPDNRTLATCGKDGTIRLWDLQRAAADDVATRDVNFWRWPTFSDDGSLLAVGEKKVGITIRRVSDGRSIGTLPDGQRPLAFGSDASTLIALGHHDELQTWRLTGTNGVCHTRAHLGNMDVRAHVFLAKEQMLILGDGDGKVRLWNLDAASAVGDWKAHREKITSLAVSPDHVLLATTSESEDDAKIWDIAKKKLKLTLGGHKMALYGVAFSPEGNQVATASVDDTVRLWDSMTGQLLATLGGHKGGTYSVDFSPDGKTLAVGGGEGELKLWNVATRRDMVTLSAEPHTVFSVKFAPEGNSLATVSFNHHNQTCALQIWRAPEP